MALTQFLERKLKLSIYDKNQTKRDKNREKAKLPKSRLYIKSIDGKEVDYSHHQERINRFDFLLTSKKNNLQNLKQQVIAYILHNEEIFDVSQDDNRSIAYFLSNPFLVQIDYTKDNSIFTNCISLEDIDNLYDPITYPIYHNSNILRLPNSYRAAVIAGGFKENIRNATIFPKLDSKVIASILRETERNFCTFYNEDLREYL